MVEREQYFDLLTLRTFRRTLLCREDNPLDRTFAQQRLQRLHFSTLIEPIPNPVDLRAGVEAQFTASDGTSISVNQPFVKKALVSLCTAWPGTLTFDELMESAAAVDPEVSDPRSMLRELLLRMYLPGLLRISLHKWPYASAVSTMPVVSRLARMQLRTAREVTTLDLRSITIDSELIAALAMLLDGTRTGEQARARLEAQLGTAITAHEIDDALETLLKLGLLER